MSYGNGYNIAERVIAVALGENGVYLNFKVVDGQICSVITFPSRGDAFMAPQWEDVNWDEVKRLLSHYNKSQDVVISGIKLSIDDSIRLIKSLLDCEEAPEQSRTGVRVKQDIVSEASQVA